MDVDLDWHNFHSASPPEVQGSAAAPGHGPSWLGRASCCPEPADLLVSGTLSASPYWFVSGLDTCVLLLSGVESRPAWSITPKGAPRWGSLALQSGRKCPLSSRVTGYGVPGPWLLRLFSSLALSLQMQWIYVTALTGNVILSVSVCKSITSYVKYDKSNNRANKVMFFLPLSISARTNSILRQWWIFCIGEKDVLTLI